MTGYTVHHDNMWQCLRLAMEALSEREHVLNRGEAMIGWVWSHPDGQEGAAGANLAMGLTSQ